MSRTMTVPDLLDLVEEFRRAGQLEPVRLANAANNDVALLREAVKAAHKKETEYRSGATEAKDAVEQAEKWLNSGYRAEPSTYEDKEEAKYWRALKAAQEAHKEGTYFAEITQRKIDQIIQDRSVVYREKLATSEEEWRRKTGLADVWKKNTSAFTTAVGLVLAE